MSRLQWLRLPQRWTSGLAALHTSIKMLIRLLNFYSKNTYGLTNDGRVMEVYRYIGQHMPEQLKPYYRLYFGGQQYQVNNTSASTINLEYLNRRWQVKKYSAELIEPSARPDRLWKRCNRRPVYRFLESLCWFDRTGNGLCYRQYIRMSY
jgi:hypothetical protein